MRLVWFKKKVDHFVGLAGHALLFSLMKKVAQKINRGWEISCKQLFSHGVHPNSRLQHSNSEWPFLASEAVPPRPLGTPFQG